MKARTLVSILIFVITVLVIVGSCATGKKAYIPQDSEELYGTWVNEEYDKKGINAKWVLKPDGTLEGYTTSDSKKITETGEFIITDKWTDSEGNIWYKYMKKTLVIGAIKNLNTYYFLIKIHKELDIAEELWSSVDYPTEFNPDNMRYNYWVFFRLE